MGVVVVVVWEPTIRPTPCDASLVGGAIRRDWTTAVPASRKTAGIDNPNKMTVVVVAVVVAEHDDETAWEVALEPSSFPKVHASVCNQQKQKKKHCRSCGALLYHSYSHGFQRLSP